MILAASGRHDDLLEDGPQNLACASRRKLALWSQSAGNLLRSASNIVGSSSLTALGCSQHMLRICSSCATAPRDGHSIGVRARQATKQLSGSNGVVLPAHASPHSGPVAVASSACRSRSLPVSLRSRSTATPPRGLIGKIVFLVADRMILAVPWRSPAGWPVGRDHPRG
jgi:hypothetical protein